ncbi:sensor histidine kinase [Fibrivirga algicola]|uniref:Histidine kinase n=1 Tax=Fibrivirga algicola TaxID=2950420 RepID=A0ABX0QEJ0_9BACT|nr:sensor histidine kinase [Fibrivirga algicola]NID09517.1 histidine kinase [Fibrivirga algicola]
MKIPAYSRYDLLLQVITLPLNVSVLTWILVGPKYWQSWKTVGLAIPSASIILYINWLNNNVLALKIQQRYSKPKQYRERVVRMFLLAATSSCLHTSLIFAFFAFIHLPGFEVDFSRLGYGLLFTITCVAIVMSVYESIHNFGYWQQSRQEVDLLTKAQLQVQLDAMRQQVNPHFLFNSLNSLISLIEEDPHQASTFAEELSTVYRYLLRSNDCPLTTLASELEFIQSYYHLLKTRHGEALTLITRIQPGVELAQLPPLTLQLLVENAVKHNVVLPEQPLTISLTATGQQLTVSNNLQRKQSRVLSNGIGLSNILTRYQALGSLQPVVEEDGQEFRVTLPLL